MHTSGNTAATSEQATIPMYRVENPQIAAHRFGDTSHPDLVGQWFSPDLRSAMLYLQKSTRTFGPNGGVQDGAQLVTMHVPAEVAEEHHVFKHPVASSMDVEGDNYLLPRDGTYDEEVLPLDDILGELRGNLGNIRNRLEAEERIMAHLGVVGVAEAASPEETE